MEGLSACAGNIDNTCTLPVESSLLGQTRARGLLSRAQRGISTLPWTIPRTDAFLLQIVTQHVSRFKHVDARTRAERNRALHMIRLDSVTKEYDLPPGQPGQLVAPTT